ncbi:hypothetical protein [Maribacter sp. IgM3_T14_3]|uniref:hypothetical protein n=1 Tax=Maribacter sp. IgM3_T14_3 TaxID=3415140 RepID=UPI003C6F96DA
MSKKGFYKLVILTLVALNIAIVAFFLTKLKPQDKASVKNIRSEILEILHLNKEQAATFNKLADEHKQQMRVLDAQQAKLLYPYFESLADSSIHIEKDSILHQIQLSERQKIELTHRHFEKIKKLLNEDQKPYFKIFTKKITQKLIEK